MNQLSARWERERRHLWGLCYRMTGDAAEAEDLVQETFSRALLHAPDTDDGHVKAWLTKVATNLAIDQLRRRRHQAYSGPWLPAPVYNDALLGLECAPATGSDLEERYGLLESASFAVLQALEHLEARARAVLILADVVGHTGPEIAEILELSPANVRQILTRARATLRELQAVPGHGGGVQSRDGGEILNAFMVALASDDVQALTELLARDVAFRSDSAGQYRAANNVVSGRDAVIALLRGLVRHGTAPAWSSMVEVNGQRAMAMRWPDDVGDERQSRRCVLLLTPTKVGIGAVSLVLADRKLCTIDFGQG